MPTVWLPPAATAVQLLKNNKVGFDLVDPIPSCPNPPEPQVNNLPPEVIAAVWIPPADTKLQDATL
jgi:hypothetical protein